VFQYPGADLERAIGVAPFSNYSSAQSLLCLKLKPTVGDRDLCISSKIAERRAIALQPSSNCLKHQTLENRKKSRLRRERQAAHILITVLGRARCPSGWCFVNQQGLMAGILLKRPTRCRRPTIGQPFLEIE
jgi:hypothetical protein